jgi:hypothetical protein
MSLLKMECIALHGRVPPFQNTVEYIDALARVKSQNGDRANELFIEPINETLRRLSAENGEARRHAHIHLKRRDR